jgi:sugar phosphate isomerase/epimerase
LFQLKIGLRLASLQLPFQKGLLTAARLGVQGVEIEARNELSAENLSRSGVRQIRKMLDDANVRVSAVAFPTRHGYEVQNLLDRRVEATKRTMQLAWDLGCNVVVNRIGHLPASDAPGWQSFLNVLDDIGRHGQRVGVMFCATTGTESGAELLRVLQALPEGSLGIDFDPAALLMNGYTPCDEISPFGRYIMHFRGNDATRDIARRTGELTPLGMGSCEIPLLLAMLEQFEYRGYITLEHAPGTSGFEGLLQAKQFLQRL